MKIKNLFSVIFSKMLITFGYKYDSSIIPDGLYCYVPDVEKNKNTTKFEYHIIPCKYYKPIDKKWNGCKYIGIITDDLLFDDQCKICNVKKYD
jgi:hypothetical protein